MANNPLKSPEIQTDYLKIYGNALEFKNTTLQLSNISLFSTASIELSPFPVWSVLCILAGILVWKFQVVLALILIAVGGVWIYVWYSDLQKKKELKKLIIATNSGNTFTIVFHNQAFLNRVVATLNEIIANPAGHRNVTVNIRDSVFQDEASVVQTLNDFSTAKKE